MYECRLLLTNFVNKLVYIDKNCIGTSSDDIKFVNKYKKGKFSWNLKICTISSIKVYIFTLLTNSHVY